jgi:hypothetical protein
VSPLRWLLLPCSDNGEDARPIVDARCASCQVEDSGASFTFDEWATYVDCWQGAFEADVCEIDREACQGMEPPN